jgi:hypothetical protein
VQQEQEEEEQEEKHGEFAEEVYKILKERK